MSYTYNPYTKKLDYSEKSKVKSIENDLDILKGEGQKTFYVATTGSDTTGDGTEGNPYASIGKCVDLIPIVVQDGTKYFIKIANGSYDSFPSINKVLQGNSHIFIDGYQDPIVESDTEYEVSSVATKGGHGVVSITTSPFTENEHFGKYIHITSGSSIGHYFPIYRNSTNSFTIDNFPAGSLSAGDTFKIANIGVEVESADTDIVININNKNLGSVTFYNICITPPTVNTKSNFIIKNSNVSAYASSFNLSDGTKNIWFTFDSCNINTTNSIKYVSFYVNNPVYPFGSIDYCQYFNSIFLYYKKDSPLSNYYRVFISGLCNIGQILVSCEINLYQSYGSIIYNSIFGTLYSEYANFFINTCSFIKESGSTYIIKLINNSDLNFYQCVIKGGTTNAILFYNQNNFINFSGSNSNFTELTCSYFAKLNFKNTLYLAILPGSTNTVNDIYFDRNTTAAAFPSAGSSVNDGELSYVARA
jgi:hypothetical protein